MVFKVTEEAKKELINTLETRKDKAMNFRVFVRGIG
jgi:Fe-S cluster assembly iron-binding protein IscA